MSDDPFIELIQIMIEALEKAGISYAITGSMVSSIFGEPVSSVDVDFAVHMNVEQARMLDERLPRRFYRSRERLEEVSRHGGIVNLIDVDTSLKIDLSVLEKNPYFDKVMSRKILTSFGPDCPSFYTTTPEDVILMKLLWRMDTKSQKQWENALSVVQVKGVSLDWKYLFEQARQLNIEDDLIRLRDEAGI